MHTIMTGMNQVATFYGIRALQHIAYALKYMSTLPDKALGLRPR